MNIYRQGCHHEYKMMHAYIQAWHIHTIHIHWLENRTVVHTTSQPNEPNHFGHIDRRSLRHTTLGDKYQPKQI